MNTLGTLTDNREWTIGRRPCLLAVVYCLFSPLLLLCSDLPDGNALLAQLDANSGSESKVITSEMTIHGRRESRTVGTRSWIRGDSQSFTEFLSPPREAGTRMLKLGDELWTYNPGSDRIIKISGHMLRQSVMGSDLSYEDMMEDRRLTDVYGAEVTGEESVLERPCWVLTLTASVPDVAYHTREIWVDKTRHIALKGNWYGKSGRLLKTTEVLEVQRLSGRWVATRAVFKDALKSGAGTEFSITDIEFDARIPDHIFSKASLRQ